MSKKPLEALTELDRKRIFNFVCSYGCPEEYFIGVEKYLFHWNKNNNKLFHALGDNLIVSVPFTYEKSEWEFRMDCERKLIRHPFYRTLNYYIRNELPSIKGLSNWDIHDAFMSLKNITKNDFTLSFKIPNKKTGKILQIQKGMKLIRVINKLFESDPEGFASVYYNYVFVSDECRKHDEVTPEEVAEIDKLRQDFVNCHSVILNDKMIKSTLSISIHPLDFMTMSDNGNDWESCMSWINNGCYHQGTVEMMNSNCVLCCYLHNEEKPWCFKDREDGDESEEDKTEIEKASEDWFWNNKKYRQLVYVTKDIVVMGKPYPFCNNEISKKILDEVKKLFTDNLNWEYSFGPEEYKDMKWINGARSMDRAKEFARQHETVKHNLIIETKAMYNDLVRDSYQSYWCYRNKVAGTKVITASGPATCLCCSGSVTEYQDDWDYFDRYNHTDEVICRSCRAKIRCSECGRPTKGKRISILNSKGEVVKSLCEYCVHAGTILKCHCCEKWYWSDTTKKDGIILPFLSSAREIQAKKHSEKRELFSHATCDYIRIRRQVDLDNKGMYIPLCPTCIKDNLSNGSITEISYETFYGGLNSFYAASKERMLTAEEFKKWRANLEGLPDDLKVTIDF